jgi:hypothetical protein
MAYPNAQGRSSSRVSISLESSPWSCSEPS